MEKAMAPYSSTLAWKIPWMEEPGRLQSMGSLRVRHGFECAGSDSDRRVPAELGQERQATSFLRNGTPLTSRVVHGVSGPF